MTEDYLTDKDKSVFEPTVPALFKKSAFFVNTVGMREAVERLVLELFREITFDSACPPGETKAKSLVPGEELQLEEQALLHIARGRGKRKRGSGQKEMYYAPLYPALARNAWPRKQAERVIGFQLIEGPIAQFLKDSGSDVRSYANDVVKALVGNSRGEHGDILQELLGEVKLGNGHSVLSSEAATEKLASTLATAKEDRILDYGSQDAIASKIAQDFRALCLLEGRVPRLFWLNLLKCFLRIALPAWLLSHMRITVMLRDWTLKALAGEVVDDAHIEGKIAARWKELFHPTQTGSNEIALHIERYVKARVELSILAYLVRKDAGAEILDSTLTVRKRGKGATQISQWLISCRRAGGNLGLPQGDAEAVRTRIIPIAQRFGAWLSPEKRGQGKNIEEFLRILLRLVESDEDDGYLLTGTKKGGFSRVVVFPGPAMIQTMLYLVAIRKTRSPGGNGKVVLADLETQFADYGIDFASSVGARPQLIAELSRLGLLKGSPDAGDSAELIVPKAA